ncbi:glutathionylspermidine synthase family protein [Aeribacillus pallidus]|uniref:glutathionylspermidine synthase family protein n=1 Tax=Aeribacillus pallidus TaxID=33936 RepID=UPI003D2141A3
MVLTPFQQKRRTFYKQIPYFWPNLYNEEYALYDVKVETQEQIERIRDAAQKVWSIFAKTAPVLRRLEDETLLQLGFPKATVPFLKLHSIPMNCVIGRFDFVVNGPDIKLLEFNADTPTFIKETFFVNGKVCKEFGVQNPNEGCEQLLAHTVRKAIRMAWKRLKLNHPPKIVFTSHDDHEEDYLTTRYLMEIAKVEAKYVSLSDLRLLPQPIMDGETIVQEAGVFTPNGEKIDILYRQTYPIEHLIDDRDPYTGEPVGQMLLEFVQNNKLMILNPVSSFLLQSKAVMALIWGLYEERHPIFTENERKVIETYFLPTYLDKDVFVEEEIPFVKKPAFGREGDTVVIYLPGGEKWIEDKQKTYTDSLPVFQQYIPLPTHTIQTEKGEQTAHIMYGCFILNGQPSAIGIRAGGPITDNASYFLPIGFK